MSKQASTETVLLPEDDLIPLALVAVEIGQSVGWVANRFGDDVVVDDIGTRAISASAMGPRSSPSNTSKSPRQSCGN